MYAKQKQKVLKAGQRPIAVCDSSGISFRCSISAVSESPCSSDRVRKRAGEGERAKGREQITKEADMMKERS